MHLRRTYTAPGGVALFQPDFAAETFEPLAVPFEHRSYSNTGHEVTLGPRPAREELSNGRD